MSGQQQQGQPMSAAVGRWLVSNLVTVLSVLGSVWLLSITGTRYFDAQAAGQAVLQAAVADHTAKLVAIEGSLDKLKDSVTDIKISLAPILGPAPMRRGSLELPGMAPALP